MKQLLPLAVLAAVSASAQTQVYDGFDTTSDYTAASTVNGLNGGQNWSDGWVAATAGSYTASSTGLSYTDGQGNTLDTSGGSLDRNAIGGFYTATRIINSSTIGGTSYFSFLVNRTAGADNLNWRIDFTDGGVSRFRIDSALTHNDGASLTNSINIHAPTAGGGGAVVSDTSAISWDQQNLIVGEIVSGSEGTFKLWVNPTDLSTLSAATTPDLEVTDNIAGTMGVFDRIYLGGTGSMTAVYDEFRLSHGTGATMADVLPFTAVPEPGHFGLLVGALALGLRAIRRRN